MTRKTDVGRLLAFSIMLVVFAFFAWMFAAGHRGSSQAQSLCASIRVGEDTAAALATMKASAGHFQSLNSDSSDLVVWFDGFAMEKYECVVSQTNGKVTKVKTDRLD